MRPFAAPFLAAALLLAPLAGCASAGKRLEQGSELEQRGRPADAARRYLDALRRDPSLQEARRGLERTGEQAVRDYLREADAASATGRPAEAAEALLRLDALVRDAAAVRVQLATGADYPERRRRTLDRAIEDALRGAEADAGRRAWGEALRRLERAEERWEPAPAQRDRIAAGRVRVQLAWAESDAAQGRYRAAHERALEAARRARGAEAERARELQAEFLRRGTVRVALLPAVATEPAARRLPAELLAELNDAMEERAGERPPLFVEWVDPRQVAREARRQGATREPAGAWEASAVGRAVSAKLVVAAVVDSVRTEESDVRTTRRAARTRAGADTAFTLHQARRETWVRVEYLLVDAESRRVVERGTVAGSAAVRTRRGTYAGDPLSLTLSREDRALFDPREQARQDAELGRQLAAELAKRLSREVLERIVRQVQ